MSGCTFAGSKQRVEFAVENRMSTSIRIRNSMFCTNTSGLFVGVIIATKQVAYQNQERILVIEVKNTIFRDHCAISETGETLLINVDSKQNTQLFKCQLYLENVTFTNNTFARMGLVYINLREGFQDLILRNIIFEGNSPLCFLQDCSELIVHGDNVSAFLSGAFFIGHGGRAVKMSARNLTAQIANSSFSGYGVNGNGSTLLFLARDFANVIVLNSTFMSIGLFGPSIGGAIHLQGTRITVIFTGCVFEHIQARSGSAVSIHVVRSWIPRNKGLYQSKSSAEQLLNVHVTDCFFKDVSSCSCCGGALSIVGPVMSVRLQNSTFVNCSACMFGGALYVGSKDKSTEYMSLNIEGSVFKGCRNNGSSGGAIHVASSRFAKVNVKKTKFLLSSSLGMAGTVAFVGPNSVMEPAKEEDSFFGSEIVISIEDSCFTGSKTYEGYGGAILIDDSIAGYNLTVRETNFTNISAEGPGGVIAVVDLGGRGPQVSSKKYITIENSRFGKNAAGGPGGAIFIDNPTDGLNLKISNTQFTKNNAYGPGGAICLFNSNRKQPQANGSNFILIESSNFLSNTAFAPGGAIFVSGGFENRNVTIKDSSFSSNNASGRGGALSIDNNSPGNYLTINNTHFIENTAVSPGGGAFLMIKFRKLIISNVTVINCKSTKSFGGAIHLSQIDDKASLLIENSLFLNNTALSAGGGLLVTMARDTLEDPGCIKEGQPEKFPKWNYNTNLLLKDTTLRYNTASFGGALNVENGRTTIQNCSFVDNFAATAGGTIYATFGSTSIVVRDSIFLQSKTELVDDKKSFSRSSFIHTESTGPFVIQNTTLNATQNNVGNSLVTVGKGGAVNFGENNLTALVCPVGSDLKFLNFSNLITTFEKNKKSCKIKVTGLDYSCIPCSAGLYSLQRGQAFGTYLTPGFQCLMCPFGANCSKNIAAKPNFWGFEILKYPPTLKFTVCPMEYCSPSKHRSTFHYNGCLGNRTGALCGRCKQGFTETLYSTQCRPIDECKDYWFWPIAACYILILALYLTFKPPIPSWIKRQILWFKSSKPVITEDQDYDVGYLKIGFYFYQAGAMFLVSTAHSRRLLETYFVDAIVGLFNFQQKIGSSGFVCPFPGFSVVTKSLFSTFHVWGILIAICLLYSLHAGFQKMRCEDSPSPGPYIGGVLQILLLGYTVLGNVSFDLLRCVPIGTERRMFYDGNVVCFQWWQYVIIAFIVTFTVPFCFVLFWGSMKLHKGALSVNRFVLACIFPLPFFMHWSFTALLGNSRDENHHSSVHLTKYVEKVLYDPFKRPVDGKGGSLGWESVLVGRRLILIITRAVVSDSFPCVMLMTFFSFLFLLHHMAKQPFRDSKANAVESISLVLLIVLGIVNLFPSALLSLAVSSTGPFADWIAFCYWVEIVIFGFVPAGCILFVVIFFISQFCRLVLVVYRFSAFFVGLCRNISCVHFGGEGQRLLAPVE